MDKRYRILVVEDVKNMRETWCAVFRHENFRADGAASSEEAMRAIDKTSYHVALVDIMLAGEKNVSDRGGVAVLNYLRNMGEPTHCLVLSGQDSDITLVRDLLKDYAVFDYIEKKNVEQHGNDIVVQKVKNASEKSDLNKPLSWKHLIGTLVTDKSDDARAAYVAEQRTIAMWLQKIEFRGGLENFSNCMVAACQHLFPLYATNSGARGLRTDRLSNVLNGLYWSKAQGYAVELIVFGKNVSRGVVDSEWNLSSQSILYDRTKADLSIVVVGHNDLARSDFEMNTFAKYE